VDSSSDNSDFELSASDAESEDGDDVISADDAISLGSDVEMMDDRNVSGMEVEDTLGDNDIDFDGSSKVFQKDNWRFKFLPYYDELKDEANREFELLKTAIASSILRRDVRPGFIYAVHDLIEFINIYGKRFSKQDHVNIVKLLYDVFIIKGLDFRVVRMVASAINTLSNRKMLITREDFRVDWRPLYDLYREIAFKNLEEEGLILFPEGLKDKVENSITFLSDFFEDNATQEILDVLRPDFCPFDDIINEAVITATLFMPTCLKHEQHATFGAGLWFDEMWHWYESGELAHDNEDRLLSLFTQLANDCPGFVDWRDKIDFILDRLMQSCGLTVGGNTLGTDSTNVQLTATLVAFNLGGENGVVQEKLTSLLNSWEDFFHPSNYGSHVSNLLTFLAKLVANVVNRVSRERYFPNRHYVHIPIEQQLTDVQLDTFVKSLLPCLHYAAFAKSKQDVARVFRHCAFLAPGIVLPTLLDLLYPALETITEPHRLLQSLNIVMNVLVPLSRDEPTPGRERFNMKLLDNVENNQSLRSHFITILNNILPGLDVNDSTKSALTFQIIATIFALMPVVDCSDAPSERSDLTEEERELCSATAGFEGIIDQVLQKCYSVIETYGSVFNPANTRQFSMEHSVQKSTEELLSERGLYVIFRSLTKNCSTQIYKQALHSFFDFMKDTVFDSRTAMDSICRIASIFVNVNPRYAFPIFFNYAWENLQKVTTEESLKQEELNISTVWYYSLLCELLQRVRGDVVVEMKEQILPVLHVLLQFHCKDAFLRGVYALEGLLYSLTSVYSDMEEYYLNVNDQPFDKYLPIRNWAKTVKKSNWNMKWHIPSPEEVALTKDLLDAYMISSLKELQTPENLTETIMLKYTSIVQHCISGASSLMPFFDGDLINVLESEFPRPLLPCTTMPKSVERLVAPGGSNLRRYVYEEIKKLALWMLEHRSNDTKNFSMIINTIKPLLLHNGIDPLQFTMRQTQHAMKKRILHDPLRGFAMTIETTVEETIAFSHQRRLMCRQVNRVTTTHKDALLLLVKLATSMYADTRIRAQQVLDMFLSQVPYSFRLIVDQVLDIIKNQKNVSHEEFKGALYILINGKRRAIVLKQDWETLLKIWPVMLRQQHSEKPSIIALFDVIVHTIAESFESFQVKFTLPESVMKSACRLLEDYEGNIHKALIGPPTAEDLITAKELENQTNEKNLKTFTDLCMSLYSTCIDSSLHWRHIDMAQSLLTLLFRRDLTVPDDIVVLFCRLLISETVRTRKSALTVITSWQKIVKIKAVKQLYPLRQIVPNTSPGAKWPIKYGIRKDNCQLIEDMQTIPQTPEEYNSTSYFTKWHIGWNTWPAEFKALAPPKNQKAANRSPDEFDPLEKKIYAIFFEPNFMDKLIKFYSLEEKKGNDSFVEMNYQLFYRCFRNFGFTVFTLVQPHLDKLIASKKEGEQRLASEIVSGLILASKLWTYDKVHTIVQWLRPRLTKCFETMTDESESNWCTSLANVFSRIDIRQIFWLYEILTALVISSTDSGFHTTFRLRILHSCVVQYEWRVPHLLRDLFRYCSTLISRNSQFLRGRIGAALASCTLHDMYGMYRDPDVNGIFIPLRINDLISMINREIKDSIWPEVLTGGYEQLKDIWTTPFVETLPRLVCDKQAIVLPPETVSRSTSVEPESMEEDTISTASAASPSATGGKLDRKLSATTTSKSPARITRALKRNSTPPLTVGKIGKIGETGRKLEKAIVITLANSIYSAWSLASPNQLFTAYELLPLFSHFANDVVDDELRTTCEELVISEMGVTTVNENLADHILKIVHLTVEKSCTWKTRITVLRFLQVNVFANIYIYKKEFISRIHDILLLSLIDQQLEVRNNAALTLSGFIRCGLFEVDKKFLNHYYQWAESTEPLKRHAGVLALSAVVTAAPYKVPSYMPDVLMVICKHVRDPQPIYATCKRTLNEFKRTHLDCWKDHKSQFNEDQLAILTNLLVSPNYYV
jgi:proteasome activator subunit 4